MLRRILISTTASHQRIAITEDGKLAELFTEHPESDYTVGNIYLGKVRKIVQGMNAAFIDIGLDQDAFLHFSDVDSTMEEDSDDEDEETSDVPESAAVALRQAKLVTQKKLPTFSTRASGQITIQLQPKQQVIVQVTREAYGTKGVRVSTKVGLTGRNVVLLPFEKSIGVSRKIPSMKERKKLRTLAKGILPEGMGCIIRTAAAGLPDEDVVRDFQTLVEEWRDIERDVPKHKMPTLLRAEAGVAHGVIRDLFKDDVSQVIVDDNKVFRDIRGYIERTAMHLRGKIELYTDSRPMFESYGIEREVHNTFARKVPLPSGGSLVLDHTEAMLVIDVNSGRASHERTQENNAVKTNFEAVHEVAKQLRLRDIGGMIMVDFIDMQQEENRRRLVNEMRRELLRDRAKTVVHPITPLGILPLTRQRIRQSMAERSSEQCPMCFGTGVVQSPETTLAAIDKWLRQYRARTWGVRLVLAAHPYLIQYIERHPEVSLRQWRKKYFVWVQLREDSRLDADEFRMFKKGASTDITRTFTP
jgi:ribonuclease G